MLPRGVEKPASSSAGLGSNLQGSPLGVYDEALLADGTPRPHVAELWRGLHALGDAELTRRKEQGDRLIRQNGVTYNVYGDPRGVDRPWELDPVPLVLGAHEWRSLSQGLDQRGRLLDAVLADLYGEQRLVRDGLLPPELVLPAPAFLRPLWGHRPAGGVFLHLLGVDLARSPDGRFWALGDRTQAPSGAGYSLENRVVVSRLFPQLFRDCRVERLAGFFQSLRDCLVHLAPPGRERPRVVLLTPGPYNETYFEHAYLARYLGYALVHGGDLTVRDRVVYLKTVGGLERVDVVLRRLDDGFCDPLSLRSDSTLGVPGLVHAVRAGHVTVANALGSGLVESPALLAFLPGLCRHLLGEELQLPSVATWWCGQPDALAYVLAHLEHLVIKSALAGGAGFEPVFAGALSREERSALADRLQREPRAYVAQEQVALSTAPVWGGTGFEPRHVSLRTFLVRSGEGYRTLPGGLVRVSQRRDSLVVSMQRGGGSKDCWVLSDGVPSSLSLLPPRDGVAIVRSGADLGSRAADNMFWLGRYLERASLTARLLRALAAGLGDDGGLAPGVHLPALVGVLEASSGVGPGSLLEAAGPRVLEGRLLEFLRAASGVHTLGAQIAAAFQAGSGARDRLSADTWRVLSQLQETSRALGACPSLEEAVEGLDRVLLGCSAFDGLCAENMVRGPGWRFADLGRRIERALHGSLALRTLLVPAQDAAVFVTALELADSAITYRARYGGHAAAVPLLDLLLADETNPRSVAFQLARIEAHLAELPAAPAAGPFSPAARVALRVLSKVRLAELAELCTTGPSGRRERLHALLSEVEADLPELADQLTLSYLTHAAAPVAYGSLAAGPRSSSRDS
jgi:uncharacterized circularly permuted ATP-grasp superfamily protein/uncharacterized alpha-E superfamily protein